MTCAPRSDFRARRTSKSSRKRARSRTRSERAEAADSIAPLGDARAQLCTALHHEAGAAFGNVRENGLTTMQADRVAQVHGEHQVDDRSGGHAERLDLEEHAHR